MTLGVVEAFRRCRIGSVLLTHLLQCLEKDAAVDHVCLHVQTSNLDALRFYLRNGFFIERTVDGYYAQNPGVVPPDAHFLRRNLKTWSSGREAVDEYVGGLGASLARAAESL
ncbi:hypothetical protein SeLEV6574_g00686 [Synchytrium endobioticum]|nr:hypothetical protein SeLEV6574_g00686 [Synchytrium endobioticum]